MAGPFVQMPQGTSASPAPKLATMQGTVVAALRNAIAQQVALFAMYQQMVDNAESPTDFTLMAATLGITTAQCAVVYALCAAAAPLVTNAAVTNLTSQVA